MKSWQGWGDNYLRLFNTFQLIQKNIQLYSYSKLKELKIKSKSSGWPGLFKELINQEINSRRTALPEADPASPSVKI